jgi:cell shape-determining protein MreD
MRNKIVNKYFIQLAISYLMLMITIFRFIPNYFLTSYSIFPALEIGVIYYVSSYKKLNYLHLFIIGLVRDVLYTIPMGTSFIVIIGAEFISHSFRKLFFIKKYINNIIIFIIYSGVILLGEYILVNMLYPHYLPNHIIYLLYFLNTVISYPVIYLLLNYLI